MIDKRLIKRICWLVVAIGAVSMLHSVIYLVYPKSNDIDASGWFIDKPVTGMRMLYWIKGFGDIFKWVLIYYAFAKVAELFNEKLFYVMCLKCFQSWIFTFTFIYNYSQSQWMNIISGVGVIGVIVIIFWPIKEKEQAIVIRM